MTTIKPLEGRTVHQIQSGQVIVDLCSVAKELVENSLDASATSIEVRFKNHGLDSIEVQDNGVGISKGNYETIALKHYTSKLSSYDELTSLKTFGFRGEALSSLCALSNLQILTAQADEAPKGTRLDFDISGKLKTTQVAPSPKGTTVAVESLFMNLPVRRRELEKNIKREYGKVLGVLQAYACISTDTKFSVSNVLTKGRKMMVFATRSNPTTRENIANVYGAKALASLVNMNLSFEMRSSDHGSRTQTSSEEKQVHVLGHVSRPVFGEGRQAPDRQMFFVNSRPCGLPQVAKVFNEIYKSYNISQSPFIFANITLDTNAYDVNVSPDKRTILLHDQNVLLESLKESLIDLFEGQDQTVPHSQHRTERLPSFKPLMLHRNSSKADDIGSGSSKRSMTAGQDAHGEDADTNTLEVDVGDIKAISLIENFVGRGTRERIQTIDSIPESGKSSKVTSKDKQKLVNKLGRSGDESFQMPVISDEDAQEAVQSELMPGDNPRAIHDDNQHIAAPRPPAKERLAESQEHSTHVNQINNINTVSGVVQNAFDRMRPKRSKAEVATITIGSNTTTAILGSTPSKHRRISATPLDVSAFSPPIDESSEGTFSSSMRMFAAPGTKLPPNANKKSNVSHFPRRPDHGDGKSSPRDQSNELHSLGVAGSHREAVAGADDDSDVASDQLSSSSENTSDEAGSDGELLDEQRKRSREDAKVAELIAQAEEKLTTPSEDSTKRAQKILRRSGYKDATTQLKQIIRCSIDRIDTQIQKLEVLVHASPRDNCGIDTATFTEDETAEERLSLTVCKEDFSRMHIVGQFNLGFILAFRPRKPITDDSTVSASDDDELFIIDQHASDEKYNFERLQSSTIVQNQPLVRPYILDLTAIEEEIIIENNEILLKNGFIVTIDTSGDEPVGRRCKLLSLPMSREVTFDTADLEELIALLADSPSLPTTTIGFLSASSIKRINSSIPRPSKVRRMFAMRACRSSVMIGKSLSKAQMEKLVRHMGEIDKPWNCPHGRPTMRHVLGLGAWAGWREGIGEEAPGARSQEEVDWKGWSERMRMLQGEEKAQYGNRGMDVKKDEAEADDGTDNDVGNEVGEEEGKEEEEEEVEEEEEEEEEEDDEHDEHEEDKAKDKDENENEDGDGDDSLEEGVDEDEGGKMEGFVYRETRGRNDLT